MPGKIGDRESEGTNALIQSGVRVALSAKDILREYELLYPTKIFVEHIDDRRFVTSQKLNVASPSREATVAAPPRYTKVRIFDDPPEKSRVREKSEPKQEQDLSSLTEERELYSVIKGKMTTDEIHRAAESIGIKKDTGGLLGLLTTLEVYGLIEAAPGGAYKRV